MKKRIIHYLGPVAGLALFVIAIWVLHRELHEYHYHDIINELHAIPFSAVLWAFFFTICNFLVLGEYEILGFKYIKNSLAWPKILLTSFIAFSFSNNVGFYSISGSAARFRLYSQWGLSTIDITRLITFSSGVTFWLGLCSVCALVFVTEPVALPSTLHLPIASTYIAGWLLLLPVIAFIALTVLRKRPVKIRSWEFEVPSVWLTVCLILFSCLDWIFFGAFFTFLKGIDYEEAIILTGMFLALAPARRHFYRKTSFVNDRFSPGWMAAVGIVIASSIWLGFFAYKHVTYSYELWWRFSFSGNASRFLRASVGSVVAFFAFGMFKLLSPVKEADSGTFWAPKERVSRFFP